MFVNENSLFNLTSEYKQSDVLEKRTTKISAKNDDDEKLLLKHF